VLSILDEESSSYSFFYSSLIALLSAGSRCDVLMRQKSKYFNRSDAKIVRCLFGICWRLLLSLPPSVSFLYKLQKNQAIELQVHYPNTELVYVALLCEGMILLYQGSFCGNPYWTSTELIELFSKNSKVSLDFLL
jgi:hypothetical protein